jgi:hypothetical protein
MRNIQITKIEGEREVEGPSLESKLFYAPINVKKVNIGTNDNPKMESIRDYWDEKIVESNNRVTMRIQWHIPHKLYRDERNSRRDRRDEYISQT